MKFNRHDLMKQFSDIKKNKQVNDGVVVTVDNEQEHDNKQDNDIPILNKVKVPFLQSTVFQMLIISVIAFAGPA